jgi:hypothetical protein
MDNILSSPDLLTIYILGKCSVVLLCDIQAASKRNGAESSNLTPWSRVLLEKV